MTISPELIADFKKILLDPKEYNFKFTAINDFFTVSNTIIPKDVLAKEYTDHCRDNEASLPKLVLYIIMDEIYGSTDGKAKNGSFGYFLKIAKK
jgi:hypothetical protein